jgi:hypothetical protein
MGWGGVVVYTIQKYTLSSQTTSPPPYLILYLNTPKLNDLHTYRQLSVAMLPGKTRSGTTYQDQNTTLVNILNASIAKAADALSKIVDALSKTAQELKDVKAELAKVEKEVPLCCVCEDQYRQSVLKPCAHFATCEGCVFKLKCCPICYSRIDSFERIFSA